MALAVVLLGLSAIPSNPSCFLSVSCVYPSRNLPSLHPAWHVSQNLYYVLFVEPCDNPSHVGEGPAARWRARSVLLRAGGHELTLQECQLKNALYRYGGYELFENGTFGNADLSLQRISLAHSFSAEDTLPTTFLEVPENVPNVSHGILFCDGSSRFWLYGGRSTDNTTLSNAIWRFQLGEEGDTWTELTASGDSNLPRRASGARCDARSIGTSFYLGGSFVPTGSSEPHYHHQLLSFSMEKECIRRSAVPDFVPVVNQRLVHVESDSGPGCLLAFSGHTEHEGVLSIAPLSQVFIYDIAADVWTVQKTSGLDAPFPEISTLGAELDAKGLPMSRFKACAAVGSAPDFSSHNVFITGGENDDGPVIDAGLLTLPTMRWINLPFPDPTNGPGADSSCILLHRRFVFMSGGCYVGTSTAPQECVNRSYDNLIYDLNTPGWANFSNVTYGYQVPEVVYSIIGGNGYGHANQTLPHFVSYADSSLARLFQPSAFNHTKPGTSFKPDVQAATLACLLAPFGCYILYLIISKAWHAARGGTVVPVPLRRPWARSHLYLFVLGLQSAALFALGFYLWYQSSLPDPDLAHRRGGLESEGAWSDPDNRLSSFFERAPNSGIPSNGLLSMYYDVGTTGEFSQRNVTSRLTATALWSFAYLPTLTFLIYGRLCRFVDVAIKRAMPLTGLRNPGGCDAESSITLSYHNFWTPLAVGQAVYYGHWPVVVSSTVMLLSAYALPIVASYTLEWRLYSGGELEWGGQFSWVIAYVVPEYAAALLGLLAISIICISLLPAVAKLSRMTKTSAEYGSLAEVKRLVLEIQTAQQIIDDLGFPLDAAELTIAKLDSYLDGKTYELCKQQGQASESLKQKHSPSSQSSKWTFPVPASMKTNIRRFTHVLDNHPYFFMMRRPAFATWMAFLLLMMGLNIWLLVGLKGSQRDQTYNYTIPIPGDLFIVAAIFMQSVFDVIEDNVRHLTVPVSLTLDPHDHPARPIFADYTAVRLPIWESLLALRDRQWLLALTQLGNLAATIYTVFLGSLQLSAASYGATNFDSDVTAATAALVLIVVVLAVNVLIACRYVLPTPRLRQPPDSLAARLALLLPSPRLRADVNEVKGLDVRRQQLGLLRNKRYALGPYTAWSGTSDERIFFGVERI